VLVFVSVCPRGQDRAKFMHRIGRCGRYGSRGVAAHVVYDARSDYLRKQEEQAVSNVLTMAKFIATRDRSVVPVNFPLAKEDEDELAAQLDAAIDTGGGKVEYAEPIVSNSGLPGNKVTTATSWKDPRLNLCVPHPSRPSQAPL